MKTAIVFLAFLALGSSQIPPQARIRHGESVIGRQFPGMISLEYIERHICGGSIVNENYVLTAAHCARRDVGTMNVVSGSNSLVDGGTRHSVTEKHIHEDFSRDINDIAVLKVDPPFVFDDNTAAVTLPQQGQATPAGSIGTLVGWGLTENGTGSENLLMVNVKISEQDECVRKYQEANITVRPQQICASTEEGNKGSCVGDSGGPLFVNGQVIGVISGSGGCRDGWPTVSSRVSYYIDWINSKINS